MKAIGYYIDQFCTKQEMQFIQLHPQSQLATAAKRLQQACDVLNLPAGDSGKPEVSQCQDMLHTAVLLKNAKSDIELKFTVLI